MSKLNSNEVLYWCHRESPFLLARIHGDIRFAVAQPSRNRSGFSVLLVDTSAGSEVSQTWRTVSVTRPPISGSARQKPTSWNGNVFNCLITSAALCFLCLQFEARTTAQEAAKCDRGRDSPHAVPQRSDACWDHASCRWPPRPCHAYNTWKQYHTQIYSTSTVDRSIVLIWGAHFMLLLTILLS